MRVITRSIALFAILAIASSGNSPPASAREDVKEMGEIAIDQHDIAFITIDARGAPPAEASVMEAIAYADGFAGSNIASTRHAGIDADGTTEYLTYLNSIMESRGLRIPLATDATDGFDGMYDGFTMITGMRNTGGEAVLAAGAKPWATTAMRDTTVRDLMLLSGNGPAGSVSS